MNLVPQIYQRHLKVWNGTVPNHISHNLIASNKRKVNGNIKVVIYIRIYGDEAVNCAAAHAAYYHLCYKAF